VEGETTRTWKTNENFCVVYYYYYYYYIIVSFIQGSHTHIPETNHVPRGYIVTAVLSLLFMVPLSYYYYYYYYYYFVSTISCLYRVLLGSFQE